MSRYIVMTVIFLSVLIVGVIWMRSVASSMPASSDQPKGLIINGVTYVPLRFVGESMGATISWDEKSQQATIIDPHSGKSITIPVVEQRSSQTISANRQRPARTSTKPSSKFVGTWTNTFSIASTIVLKADGTGSAYGFVFGRTELKFTYHVEEDNIIIDRLPDFEFRSLTITSDGKALLYGGEAFYKQR